jgi:hypothetical protein
MLASRALLPIALLPLAVLAACSGGDGGATDTDGTGEDGITAFERLGAPDKYIDRWNWEDGCETQNGPGVQVYWYSDDAVSVENGDGSFTFTATETWYWFHGGGGGADCRDVWEITGTLVTTNYDLLNCSSCEEVYRFERRLVEQGCQYQYHQLFGYEEEMAPPEEPVFDGYLLFDTHNELNDAPNENNGLLVYASFRRPDNQYVSNNNYSLQQQAFRFVDDPDRIGPPGEYEWAGTTCVGTSGGGGGGA